MTNFHWKLVTFGAALFFAFLCLLFFPFVADDAYIVGRYAQNAATGGGLVYNIDERVSALTSPLHALVLSLMILAVSNPVEVYRSLAILLPLLGWAVAVRIYRPTPRETAIVSVIALASPFLALWSVGGLETPILTMFLTLFAAFLMKVVRRKEISNGDMFALGTLAATAFLVRFDSIIRHFRQCWQLPSLHGGGSRFGSQRPCRW